MRVQLLAALLLLALLALLVPLGGCGQMPVTSMVKLARIDFATTDLSALRAGLKLPSGLRPLPGTGRLMLVVEPGDGTKVDHAFKLTEVTGAEAAKLRAASGAGDGVRVYTIPPTELLALERFRHHVLVARGGAASSYDFEHRRRCLPAR
jgi:hypothetical protein